MVTRVAAAVSASEVQRCATLAERRPLPGCGCFLVAHVMLTSASNMNARPRYLRLLGTVFFVLAWLTAAWALFSLFTAQIDDEYHYDMYSKAMVIDKRGIGFAGAFAIAFDAALRFLMLMGASQAIKLWLHLEQAVDGLAMRLGEIIIATTDIKAGIVKTSADVRRVGSIVYEEAKKDD